MIRMEDIRIITMSIGIIVGMTLHSWQIAWILLEPRRELLAKLVLLSREIGQIGSESRKVAGQIWLGLLSWKIGQVRGESRKVGQIRSESRQVGRVGVKSWQILWYKSRRKVVWKEGGLHLFEFEIRLGSRVSFVLLFIEINFLSSGVFLIEDQHCLIHRGEFDFVHVLDHARVD